MPVFNDISLLLSYMYARINSNGTQAITGAVHRDVMESTILSLFEIMFLIPDESANDFPPWDAEEVYDGGTELVVRHNGYLWLFIKATDSLAQEPGTNTAIWQQLSALSLSHFRNRDQYLDEGGPYQVSAQELYMLLNAPPPLTWRNTIQDYLISPTGGEPNGHRVLVKAGAGGAFAGHDHDIAVRSGASWVFEPTLDGDAVRQAGTTIIWLRDSGIWSKFDLVPSVPSLSQVLAAGEFSGLSSITLERPIIEIEYQYTHMSAGYYDITVGMYPRMRVVLNANITLGASNFALQSWWWLITCNTNATITWQVGHWSYAQGVTLPTAVLAGENYMIRATGGYDRPMIVSVDKIINV